MTIKNYDKIKFFLFNKKKVYFLIRNQFICLFWSHTKKKISGSESILQGEILQRAFYG